MTKLFVCESCMAVDSTDATAQPSAPPYKCSECLTGHWHGYFPKKAYDPATDVVINRISKTPTGESISLG